MGSLAEEAAAEVEQHLLHMRGLPSPCDRKADAYIRAMKKRSAQLLPAEPERSRWNFRFLIPAFAVCALLIAAAVGAAFSPPDRPIAGRHYALRNAGSG